MSSAEVLLSGRVDSNHKLVRYSFRYLSLLHARCPHDISDKFVLRVTPMQWSCAIRDATSAICLQAFVLGECLDAALEGESDANS